MISIVIVVVMYGPLRLAMLSWLKTIFFTKVLVCVVRYFYPGTGIMLIAMFKVFRLLHCFAIVHLIHNITVSYDGDCVVV